MANRIHSSARHRGKSYTAQDVWFTSKGKTLSAFAMGWPEKEAVIGALGAASKETGKVQNVELLGFKARARWAQEATGLGVQMPVEKSGEYSIAFKIALG